MPDPRILIWLVLNALTAYRIVRLISRDVILKRPRDWLRREYDGWVVTLVHCPWCLGVWVGGLTVVPTLLCPGVWMWVALTVSVMTIVGFLGQHDKMYE
jgi:hypothetical protein